MKCDLYPLDRRQVLARVPNGDLDSGIKPAVSSVLVNMLEELRYPKKENITDKKKRVSITPGKSVSLDDIQSLPKKRKRPVKEKPRKNKKKAADDKPPVNMVEDVCDGTCTCH